MIRTTYYVETNDARRIVTPIRLINPLSKREVVVNGLWDTGADVSVILKGTADFLQLVRSEVTGGVDTIGGKAVGHVALTVALPGDQSHGIIVEPFEVERLSAGIDFVIGMDIIGEGDLTITRRGGGLALAFTFGDGFFRVER